MSQIDSDIFSNHDFMSYDYEVSNQNNYQDNSWVPDPLYYHSNFTDKVSILYSKGKAYKISYKNLEFFIPKSIVIFKQTKRKNKIFIHDKIFSSIYREELNKKKVEDKTIPLSSEQLFVKIKSGVISDQYSSAIDPNKYYEAISLFDNELIILENKQCIKKIHLNFYKINPNKIEFNL